MIFVDSINEGIALTKYLYKTLSNKLKDKTEQVIQCYHSNLSEKSRKLVVEDFPLRNTCIWIYITAASLGINIPNVLCMAVRGGSAYNKQR